VCGPKDPLHSPTSLRLIESNNGLPGYELDRRRREQQRRKFSVLSCSLVDFTGEQIGVQFSSQSGRFVSVELTGHRRHRHRCATETAGPPVRVQRMRWHRITATAYLYASNRCWRDDTSQIVGQCNQLQVKLTCGPDVGSITNTFCGSG
jgi:hypothetical protein